jgi:hypothetical protein
MSSPESSRIFPTTRSYNHRLLALLAPLLVIALLGAACSTGSERSGTAESQVSLFFLRGATLGVTHARVHPTPNVEAATLNALLAGPTMAQESDGLSSALLPGTVVNSLTVSGGVATVNFNGTFSAGYGTQPAPARLAEVVFTLTQFPTIRNVRIEADGQVPPSAPGDPAMNAPVSPEELDGLLPAIFVETPASGDALANGTVAVSGLSDVPEFTMELIDSTGATVTVQTVHTSTGSGTWVPFALTIYTHHVPTGSAQLQVFDVGSDGTHNDVYVVPFTVH